nr:TIGR03759 family integrating conjugative element protein [uncultured Pseudomonas sp.]
MHTSYSFIPASLAVACYLVTTQVSAALPSYKEVDRFERDSEERSSGVLKPTETPSAARQSSLPISDEARAQEWGLSSQEYQRYRTLMQGSRGVYSPGLDPLTALGIEAQSDAERRRYAELQVRAEAQRVQKELAYEQAYQEAWKRLYPNLQPVMQVGGGNPPLASPTIRGSGRLAVFVTDSCAACTERVQALQDAGQPFDLYLIGSQGDDARIRHWAVLAGIDPAKVRARQITLNHDGGRWVQLGLGGELPAVVREVNGQWLRQ